MLPVNRGRIMDNINRDRRRFFGGAAATATAAHLGMLAAADAQPDGTKLPAIKPGTNTSFAPLKQIDAGVLNVAYAEAGPADGDALRRRWRCFRGTHLGVVRDRRMHDHGIGPWRLGSRGRRGCRERQQQA